MIKGPQLYHLEWSRSIGQPDVPRSEPQVTVIFHDLAQQYSMTPLSYTERQRRLLDLRTANKNKDQTASKHKLIQGKYKQLIECPDFNSVYNPVLGVECPGTFRLVSSTVMNETEMAQQRARRASLLEATQHYLPSKCDPSLSRSFHISSFS